MPAPTLLVRTSKIVLAAGLGFWTFLVTLGNVTDYETNWAFVQHVMAMDTIFPDSDLTWRAVKNPQVQRLAYVAIMIAEGATSLAFFAAALLMLRKVRATNAEFVAAKSSIAVAVTLGFAVWFCGFVAIGGEWFAMWQSQRWNAQDSAFRITLTILAAAVYVFLDNDGEPEPRSR